MLRVSEIECKMALVPSGLADYALNCYRGCQHGCIYCYARFASRFSHPDEEWGTFVDVRVNAPEVLVREVRRRRRGRVFMCSVCDGWQPLEGKYQLTRRCLEVLLRHGFSVTILTKSRLVSRDLDLLPGAPVELGVTVTTLDEGLRRIIEPHSSPSAERLAVLEEAKGKGITTYAFLGPLMPCLSDTEENLRSLLRLLKEIRVDYFYIDRLNPRPRVWLSLSRMLVHHFPSLLPEYRRVLYDPRAREDYSQGLVALAVKIAGQYSLEERLRFCF